MPKHAIIVLLLCASCAAPTPSQYERGTFVRPPAPVRRPGVGAPTYDPHAPKSRPDVEPQPRPKRYLPPEPDGKPGIWASESDPTEHDVVFVLEEPMLAPTVHNERLSDERTHIMECGADIDETVRKLVPSKDISNMDQKVRACLAHMLMERCFDNREEKRKHRAAHERRLPGATNAKAMLAPAREAACRDRTIQALSARELNALYIASGGNL